MSAQSADIPRWQTLGLSGAAGMFAWLFAHPFEMWKNTVMTAPPGTSQADAFKATAKKGFYTGLSGGLTRQIVYATVRLGCYPIFRDGILSFEHKMGWKESAAPNKATILDRALAGGASGAFASFLSSPVEVCLVLQTTSADKPSIFGACRRVYQGTGIAGFWRGIGPLASRAALVGISQVAVHDQVLTYLRGKNSVRPAPLNDNLVINIASVITAFFYSIVTMPVEFARVRMSAEAKLGPGVEKRYTNMFQCLARATREEGMLTIFGPYFPYFLRCGSHTIVCFFAIESGNKFLKARRAAAIKAEENK